MPLSIGRGRRRGTSDNPLPSDNPCQDPRQELITHLGGLDSEGSDTAKRSQPPQEVDDLSRGDAVKPSQPAQEDDDLLPGDTTELDQPLQEDENLPDSDMTELSQPIQEGDDPPHGVSDITGNTRAPQQLHPESLWFEDHSVVRHVTKSIHSYFKGPYTCWKNATQIAKDKWWHHFRDLYQWRPEHATDVKNSFEAKAAMRLKDLVYKEMKKPAKPCKWMSPAVKRQLMELRETPEFKKKSEQYMKNKTTGPKAGTRHSQGSVSTASAAKRLRHDKGKMPTASEIFQQTHQRKDKSFVDERSKEVWEKYQSMKSQVGQDLSGLEDDRLFLEAVGGWTNKGTVYGLGSGVTTFFSRPRSESSSPSTSSAPSLVSQLEQVLNQTKEELNQTKQELTETKQQLADQKKSLAVLQENFNQLSQFLHQHSGGSWSFSPNLLFPHQNSPSPPRSPPAV